MDATRNRRTRDDARRRWYAASRCRRFARFLGFPPTPAGRDKKSSHPALLPTGNDPS